MDLLNPIERVIRKHSCVTAIHRIVLLNIVFCIN